MGWGVTEMAFGFVWCPIIRIVCDIGLEASVLVNFMKDLKRAFKYNTSVEDRLTIKCYTQLRGYPPPRKYIRLSQLWVSLMYGEKEVCVYELKDDRCGSNEFELILDFFKNEEKMEGMGKLTKRAIANQ